MRCRQHGMRAALAAALAVALGGCALASSDPLAEEQRELNRNRRQWTRQGLADYRFEVRRICFCGGEVTRPVAVEVRGGEVVSVSYVEDGEPVAENFVGLWPPIDGVFEIVQDAIDREAHRLRVEYDPALGYPTDISIDYAEQMADEELGLIVEKVEAVSGGG